ncbi:MAG: hypothetical protein R3B13_38395 [Polyangiaceae bacterium]
MTQILDMVPERLVLCVRQRGRAETDVGLAELVRRAEAQGGRIVAWQSGSVAFDFDPDAIEDAVELVMALPEQCSAGVAQGTLDVQVEAGSKVALSWGEGLVRATQLARIARVGEVLLSPTLPQAQSGEVLTRGTRLGLLGKERVRGLRLDLSLPLRPGSVSRAPEASTWLSTPLPTVPAPGAMLEVWGPRGAGGTRALCELSRHVSIARTMMVRPRLGEPLGALRDAFRHFGPTELPPALASSLEGLLAGEGLELDSSAELVQTALGPGGVVLIDDADRVDMDTLEAIHAARTRGGIGVVARKIEPSGTKNVHFELAHFTEVTARAMVHALIPDLAERDAARLAHRGGGGALGIRESVLEAVESGLLLTRDGHAALRVSVAGRNRPQPAQYWVERRLRWFSEAEQLLLGALAVWGGDATDADLAALVEREEASQIASALTRLVERGWLTHQHDRVAFHCATIRDVALAALPEARRARLHRRACAWLTAQDTTLGAVTAGVHALLGGDDGGSPLLRRGWRGSTRLRAGEDRRWVRSLHRRPVDPEVLESCGLPTGAIADRAGLQRESVSPVSLTHPAPGPQFLQSHRRRRALFKLCGTATTLRRS